MDKEFLKDCFKGYTWDQDKTVGPEITVARVREKMTAAGIDLLHRTERIDNGRLDIPVFVSVCGRDALEVMPTRKQMGKGATPAQAEASAVMEMVERYSFYHFIGRRPWFEAEYDQVKDRAMPFEHLAASVHHDPRDLDRARLALGGLKLAWTTGYNLTRKQECLVPFNWFYEINQFNGSSAGNTLEEAVSQGLFEVVERHVSALVSRGRLATPSIDPESLQNPVSRELRDNFRRAGVQVFLKDFSLGQGIPTVAALAYDPATFPGSSEIVFTAGTASDPEKALIRALTEVAQLGGDFNTKSNFLASGLPKFTDPDQADYIIGPAPLAAMDSLPNLASDNIKTEIERAAAALAGQGLEVYVVDVTHPDLGIPAVYVIIPGAHFRERAVGASVPFFAAKLLAAGDDAEAFFGLSRLLEIYPEGYYLHFHQGQALLEQGLAGEAAEALTLALEMDPPGEDLAGILTYLGLARKELEDYHGAISALEKSIAADPERQDAYNLLGVCLFKTKQHERAIDAFRHVLKIDPGSGIDYANIAVNYRELGRKDDAIENFRVALELDPSLDWAWQALARLENSGAE
ncbi:MAG: YcaO-like family protein [Pseudomonadota bacterium]